MTTPHAQAQRERIIAAAQCCFEAEGFHAAGMARIAATAGVSPGLLYRYFESKEAIIAAIVQRQLDAIMAKHALEPPKDGADLARRLTAKFGESADCQSGRSNPKLVLEVSAEATRNPAIGAVVSHFDATLRRLITDWLSAPVAEGGRGLSPAKAAERALALQLLFEGLMVREAREPDLDRQLLARTLAVVVPALLD